MIRLHFRDKNPAVVSALAAEFAGCVDVEVSSGNILRLAGDAIVSPANSFGWMDGGIDLAYLNRFGQWLQPALQGAIAEHFGGELPIGQALIVETHDGSIPFMISAPTMRVPAPVPHSNHAYLALRAALRVATIQPGIQSVLCPGLCTLTGRMHPAVAAAQMRRAYDEGRG
jgi:O-acetyl-ADP-ribose deacetylase (regulator of RNase III)